MQKKIKKIIPYLFILALIIGFFSPIKKVWAADPPGHCWTATGTAIDPSIISYSQCKSPNSWGHNTAYNSTGRIKQI